MYSTSSQLNFANGMLAKRSQYQLVTWVGHQVLHTNPSGKIFVEANLRAVDVSQFGLPPGTLLLDGYVRLPDDSLLASN